MSLIFGVCSWTLEADELSDIIFGLTECSAELSLRPSSCLATLGVAAAGAGDSDRTLSDFLIEIIS